MKKLLTAFCAVILLFSLASCGSSLESNLPGSWDNGFHTLTFYSDGTYEETTRYGTGTWKVLDGNTLKLTDFYGETKTYQIDSVSSSQITFESGVSWKKIS